MAGENKHLIEAALRRRGIVFFHPVIADLVVDLHRIAHAVVEARDDAFGQRERGAIGISCRFAVTNATGGVEIYGVAAYLGAGGAAWGARAAAGRKGRPDPRQWGRGGWR